MKVFKDLKLFGSSQDFNRVLSEIDRAVASRGAERWSRKPEYEQRLQRDNFPGIRHVRCYEIARALEEGKSALLWIAQTNDELYVSNIVPAERGSLGMDAYNCILTEFFENFVTPAAEQIPVRPEITPEDQTIDDWTEPEVAQCLRYFSSAANKSTGSSHPADKERWHRFIVGSHKSSRRLSSGQLKRWLIEEQGWPEETAIDLVIEYEQGLELLRYYDNQR